MARSVTPMIHVPDVKAAAEWYRGLGFEIVGHNPSCDGGWDWARVAFGETAVMFYIGGRASDAERREVDLYVQTEDVDALFDRLRDQVEIVEPLHDTEYGMREFIVRDLNRFWITFGRPIG